MLIFALLLAPAVAGALCLLVRSARGALALALAGVLATAALAVRVSWDVFRTGPVATAAGWFQIDALSAFHLLVMVLVFALSSAYAFGYFGHELEAGKIPARRLAHFGALWCGALGAMTLVLISNNLGIMWVGVEATTLLTAFLICVHTTPTSLEAMWKYLLVCSVGVAFAFMGTLLAGASAAKLHLSTTESLLWTRLSADARFLDPASLKAAFLFLLVGYGTKAGLAPLHSWLPDAHSQAPAPVSAIFSGFMLNTALYCIMRYMPLVEAACGFSGFTLGLLAGFGLLSIIVAAAFIVFQHDAKRLLAYHSVEHLGIISLGLGLGGLGTFAALFHTLNHSVCKTLSFFAAGRLGQIYGTHDMGAIAGTLRRAPVWGLGLFGSILALIGVAPFALFMSELQIMRAAVERGSFLALALFLGGAGIVFVGALRHAVAMAWGEPAREPAPEGAGPLAVVLSFGPLLLLLVLGLYMPEPLRAALDQAARIIGGRS